MTEPPILKSGFAARCALHWSFGYTPARKTGPGNITYFCSGISVRAWISVNVISTEALEHDRNPATMIHRVRQRLASADPSPIRSLTAEAHRSPGAQTYQQSSWWTDAPLGSTPGYQLVSAGPAFCLFALEVPHAACRRATCASSFLDAGVER
jgi:hypothetical protein